MNVENILKVADAIEQHSIAELGFNMATWYSEGGIKDRSGHNCGTVACIGGWTQELLDRGESATSLLGLDDETADKLMCPPGWSRQDHPTYTPEQAVATLRHLAATGEVDWTVGVPDQAQGTQS